jgi:hypothetical protein
MKLTNRHGIASCIGIQALCIPLLYSFSLSAPAVSSLEGTPLAERSSGDSSGLASGIEGVVVRSTGAIEADVQRFRSLLGNPNNGATPGEAPEGRREINWDAVPAAVTNVIDFPATFFNVNSPRGLVYDQVSRGLEVSDNRFTDINPTYASEFNPFSGQKMFSAIGNNEASVQFLVAGSSERATVRGIGVVFLDVDSKDSSGIILIGEDGSTLGRILAPARSDARGASFVGVVFQNPLIARARIVAGDGILSPDEDDVSQGGRHDLVVMDDFLYGEPTGPRH